MFGFISNLYLNQNLDYKLELELSQAQVLVGVEVYIKSICNLVKVRVQIMTFPIYPLTKDFRKKIWIFLGGYSYFGPPKPVTDQKWPPMPANDPPILMQNPFSHKKWGCLQKTRALYLKKWLSYGHIKFRKRKSQNFQKWLARLKNCNNSVNFWDIVEFFFLIVTDGPL